MKIVVCYKNVPDEQDIQVNRDGSLNFDSAMWKIGIYDLNAVEAGMKLAESCGGEVIALTAAGEAVSNSKMRKAILSRGPHRMIGIQDGRLDRADCYTVAKTLAAAVRKIGGVDLLLFGEGSGDTYAQQTGSMVGALLQWPTLNAVQSLVLREDGTLRAERSLENRIEVFSVALPAAISVTSDINIPRIPSMKDILGAGKKPADVWPPEEAAVQAEGRTKTVSILAAEETARKNVVFESDSEENIEAFYRILQKPM